MRKFSVASISFLCLSALPFAAHAITVSELPTSIQSCITAGECAVNYDSSYDSATASAFSIFDVQNNQSNWLMRYALVSPSGQTDLNSAQTSPYGGYLWMQVASKYSTLEYAPVTLYLDKVTPVPESLSGQSGDLSLFVTSADLLAGGAYKTIAYTESSSVDEGSLMGEIPLICLADGCQIKAELNFVQLRYQDAGSYGIVMTGFDASDERGLVYLQNSSYLSGDPLSGVTQTFYIQAIPEPGTSWLFGFGLMAVFTVIGRRKKDMKGISSHSIIRPPVFTVIPDLQQPRG